MDISKCRRQSIHACRDELFNLLRRGLAGLQPCRVHDTVLTTLNASRLGLGRNLPVVAVFYPLRRLAQIRFLLMMRHVNHDTVKWQHVRGKLDDSLILRVVEVDGNGDAGALRCVGSRSDQ